jgi:hypothetical protein
LKQKKRLKLQVYLSGLLYHATKDQEEEKVIISRNKYILNKDDIKIVIDSLLNQIKIKIDSWDNSEAYWCLQKLLFIDFKLRKHKPICGFYIHTPKYISGTKSTINIKNEDQRHFKYCVLYESSKNEIKKKGQEIYNYKKLEKKFPNVLNFERIQFPFTVQDIKKFCQLNSSINTYLFEENTIIPHVTYSEKEKRERHINLLLLNVNDNYHYIYNKNLSRLIQVKSIVNNIQRRMPKISPGYP